MLSVPDKYVGKKIEVLMYAAEELSESKPSHITMSAYKGILSNGEADQLQMYIKQSREEWDNSI